MTVTEWLYQTRYFYIELNTLRDIKSDINRGAKEYCSEAQKVAYQMNDYINQLISEAEERISTVENTIEAVNNELYKTILRERFINNKKWFQIAQIINYSEKHLEQVLYPKALESLNNSDYTAE